MTNWLYTSNVIKHFGCLTSLASLYYLARSDVTVITEGRNFLLAYPENLPDDCQFAMDLIPVLAPMGSLQANISVPALNANLAKAITLGSAISLSLREVGLSPPASSNTSRNNIIHVNVISGKLSLIGSITCTDASTLDRKYGEFLAIPVEFWGTSHIVISPAGTTCGYTVTVLTAGFSTAIKVLLKTGLTKHRGYVQIRGQTMNENVVMDLEPNSRLEIFAVYTDITGSIIESNFPIGLLVGPNNVATLDDAFCSNDQGLFVEQLIPTYAWGKRYYLNDGGASGNIFYKYYVRTVTSTAATTVYYDYVTSFENNTIRFKSSKLLTSAGDIYNFTIKRSFGFEMVAADSPIMVVVYTEAFQGGDGAMNQAVQYKAWPERVTLRLNSSLGQRVHLFTDSSCLSDIRIQTEQPFAVVGSYAALNFGKVGTDFYIPSTTSGSSAFPVVLSVNTDIQGCHGISAFIMNEVRSENDELAACPVFWSIECSDGEVGAETTTSLTITLDPQPSSTSTNLKIATSAINITDLTTTTPKSKTDTVYSSVNESTSETVTTLCKTVSTEYSKNSEAIEETSTRGLTETGNDVNSSGVAVVITTETPNRPTEAPEATSTVKANRTLEIHEYINQNTTLWPTGRNNIKSDPAEDNDRDVDNEGSDRDDDVADSGNEDGVSDDAINAPQFSEQPMASPATVPVFAESTSSIAAGAVGQARPGNQCPCTCEHRPNKTLVYRAEAVEHLKAIAVFISAVVLLCLPSAVNRTQKKNELVAPINSRSEIRHS